MKMPKLIKGAFQKQLLKGVGAKGSIDGMVYNHYYSIIGKAIVKNKISAVDYRILKTFLGQARAVKKPNKYTKEIVSKLPIVLENRKNLEPKDVKFLEKKLLPYLKSCQVEFFQREMEVIEPLMKEVK